MSGRTLWVLYSYQEGALTIRSSGPAAEQCFIVFTRPVLPKPMILELILSMDYYIGTLPFSPGIKIKE